LDPAQRFATVGLDDWTLTEANGVSYNGLTIVGTGLHDGINGAWVATIPEPSTLGLAVIAGLGSWRFVLGESRFEPYASAFRLMSRSAAGR
jgi:hypothetical protein